MRWLNEGSFFVLMTALLATPTLASDANFGSLTLKPGFSSANAYARGTTGGAVSLSSLKNKDDIKNRPCIGYGSPNPDHIIVLQKDFSHLKLQVNSGGKNTTLVVEGPDGVFRCSYNTGKDASIDDPNWKAGRYLVWVGAIDAGQRWDYALSANE